MLNLSKQILDNRKVNTFLGATVTGAPGSGKTVYTLKVAREIYWYDHPEATKGQLWDWAFSNIVHTLDELVDALEGHSDTNKRKFLIWDDVGAEAGVYAFSKGYSIMDALKSVMDLIRTSTECLLITTVTQSGLLKFIRDYRYQWINVGYIHGHGWDRFAQSKISYVDNHGQRRWRKKYRDLFSAYVPNEWYAQMNPYRVAMQTGALESISLLTRQATKRKKVNELKLDKKMRELEAEEENV